MTDAGSDGAALSDTARVEEAPAESETAVTDAGKRKGAVKRAAETVAESAKKAPAVIAKAPAVIAKDALVMAAASQPYLKAAIEKQRAAAGGSVIEEGTKQTPASDRPAATPGPVGLLAAGVAEAVVEKVVGLVANKDAAHKAGVAAAKAVAEMADKAATAAAEKAIRAVAGQGGAALPTGARSAAVEASAAASDAGEVDESRPAETPAGMKATKSRKKSGREKALAKPDLEGIPSPS